LGGAALGALGARARAQTAITLRIASIPLESSCEAAYARDMGFLAKTGLEGDIQTMVNGAAIAAAIVSGGIDIGYIPVDTLAAIHQKGIPLVAVAPCTEYVSGAQTGALLVGANSPVHTGKDLTGKTVAVVALNGVTHLATRAWIDQTGGDSATVKYVELAPSAMPATANPISRSRRKRTASSSTATMPSLSTTSRAFGARRRPGSRIIPTRCAASRARCVKPRCGPAKTRLARANSTRSTRKLTRWIA
jgi:hypothetical protein